MTTAEGGDEHGNDTEVEKHHDHSSSFFGKVIMLEDVGNAGVASLAELFYDLIFVAGMYRMGLLMGDLLTHEDKGEEWYEVMLLFMIMWLTWHHANMFLARFKLEKVWSIMLYMMMCLTVFIAISQVHYIKIYETCEMEGKPNGTYVYKACMYKGYSGKSQVVEYGSGDKDYHYQVMSGLRQPRFMTVWGLSRLIMALLYVAAAYFNQKHGWKMCAIYAGFLTLSGTVVLLVGNLSDGSIKVIEPVCIIIMILEFGMYPAALALLDAAEQLSIDVEHNVERAELWAVLVMGETMLTLVQGASEKYDPDDASDREYYLAVFLGFIIEVMMLEFYKNTLPHGHGGMDTHIYDLSQNWSILYDLLHLLSTLGLFGFGVGLKYTMKYGHYSDGKSLHQHYCFFITGCLCLSIVCMNAGRYIHEWAEFKVCGILRKHWWIAHFVVAGCVVPVAYAVSIDSVTGAVTGVRATSFLGILAGIVSLTLVIDIIVHPPHEVQQDYKKFVEEVEQLKTNTGTPVGVDADKVDAELLQKHALNATPTGKFRKKGKVTLRFSARAMNAAREAFHSKDHDLDGVSDISRRLSLAKVKDVGLFSLYQENLDETDPTNALSNKSLAKQMWKRATMRASIGHGISNRKWSLSSDGAAKQLSGSGGSLRKVSNVIEVEDVEDVEEVDIESGTVQTPAPSIQAPSASPSPTQPAANTGSGLFNRKSSKVAPADATDAAVVTAPASAPVAPASTADETSA